MVQAAELAQKLKERGNINVLALHQAALVRGMLQPWIHDGIYYILPPEGMTGMELQHLMDEYRERDALHLSYNAQSVLDTNHKPILSLDSFSEKYFGDPKRGMVKVSAVSRQKVGELNALIEEFKKPFIPSEFPALKEFELSEYRAPSPGSQTTFSLKLIHEDWKHLIAVEDALKVYLSEINMLREVLVSRHNVQGLQPEIVFTSTEETTDKGNQFMADLAQYMQDNGQATAAVIRRAQGLPPEEILEDHASAIFTPRELSGPREKNPAEFYREALETLVGTLKDMKGFEKLEQTITGNMLLIQFRNGLLGIGGHFGKAHAQTLETVYKGVRSIPMFEHGWSAHYHYSNESRVLGVQAAAEDSHAPPGWKALNS